jgi:hypothetical protein
VECTATGAVIGTLGAPKVLSDGWVIADDLAAAPSARTFYAEYDAASRTLDQIWIYRFSITSSGSVTAMSRIRGGTIPGNAGIGDTASLAVSPDGTKLALTADSTKDLGNKIPGYADKIIVIDLRTGARTVWQGDLYRSGKTFSIPYLSWAPDGKSLVYLGQWCDLSPAAGQCPGGGSGPQMYRDTQVRSLAAATGGGLLDGTLLFGQSARYPVIAGVLAGPDGDLTLLVLSGHLVDGLAWSKIAVERVSASGTLLGVDYHSLTQGSEGQPEYVSLSADPSGRYLLVGYNGKGGLAIGWIGQGKFHRLMPPHLGNSVTAW